MPRGLSAQWCETRGSVTGDTMGMTESLPHPGAVLRAGALADVGPCVALWVEACAARDGVAVPGVAERARPKFDRAESWVVASDPDGSLAGFTVATAPGSGLATDPSGAAGVGLLAVAPRTQGRGIGAELLSAVTADLARIGHRRAVLHVLLDNDAAVRLYRGQGWLPWGQPSLHGLLARPMQTYVLDLGAIHGAPTECVT